jgi:hypothetical protein
VLLLIESSAAINLADKVCAQCTLSDNVLLVRIVLELAGVGSMNTKLIN